MCIARRVFDPVQSDIAIKGLLNLNLTEPTLSSSLRLVLMSTVPPRVREVTLAVPSTLSGRVLLNCVRHALGLSSWDQRDDTELRRLQLLSQCVLVMESSRDWRYALETYGLATLLYAPLISAVLDFTNKARGRIAYASQRNALAHFYACAVALCRWVHVVEQLRQPLYDWYANKSKEFERGAREAKRIHRLTATDGGEDASSSLPDPALPWASNITIEGKLIFKSKLISGFLKSLGL